ncbi:MAG: hypothetical protein JW894_07660 [Bacteroidales bacterium]|nr:hypothetical protein [Bacteroidales bacterium]
MLFSKTDTDILGKRWTVMSIPYNAEFAGTYLLIHHAVQFLSLISKSVFPPRYDDSHTCLFWDFSKMDFTTDWFYSKKTQRLEFDPVHLKIKLAEYGGEFIAELDLKGKTKKEVYAQLRNMLAETEFQNKRLLTEMHYDMPRLDVKSGGNYRIYNIGYNNEIRAYYSNAFLLLNLIKGKIPDFSEIRCWPHHFDITIDYYFKNNGMDRQGLTAGFSPADINVPEPYYFIKIKGNGPISIKRTGLSVGNWLNGDEPGTFLKISEIIKKEELHAQIEAVFQFFSESITNIENIAETDIFGEDNIRPVNY